MREIARAAWSGLAGRLARFGAVGLLATGATFVVYRTLLALSLHHLLVGVVTWSVGLAIAFVGNRRFTFGRSGPVRRGETAWFLVGYALQLVVGLIGFEVTLGVLGWPPTAAYVAVLVPTAATSFLFMQAVTFGRPTGATA